MANMSYCRFRNTLQDLQDCHDNIHDSELSKDEAEALEQLIELCRSIAKEFPEEK